MVKERKVILAVHILHPAVAVSYTHLDVYKRQAYVMNEYSVLVHGFRDGHIKESLAAKKLDETFQTQTNIDDLYSYIRLDTINQLNEDVGLVRIQIIAADGPSDYMRPILNKMDAVSYTHLDVYKRQLEALTNVFWLTSSMI